MAETAIIGAGLAGLALVQRLLDHGAEGPSITLVDAGDATRASDVPGTLMHPFPGRSMAPKPGQLVSAKTSVDFLRRLEDEAGEGTVIELPMARPLVGEMGEKLRSTWQQAREDYPDWFDSRLVGGADLGEVDPNLAKYDEALVYAPAFSVDTNKLRRHLRAKFRDAGVQLVDGISIEGLRRTDTRWRLMTGGEDLGADQVVLALGAGLGDWFPALPMRNRGGEVLLVQPPSGAELRCVINCSGHVAPRGDGAWVAGSTYWSPEEFEERTDELATRQVLKRCTRLVAQLDEGEPVAVGRGVRAMYRGDNRPLVGPVAGQDELYVFGALGSKGLLRIPELADQLACALRSERAIDERATSARVKVEKWQPAANRIR